MKNHHFLLVCFPLQSHINPTLTLATKLTGYGARVTVATTVHGLKNLPSNHEISYDSFSDGQDDVGASRKPNYFQEMKLIASTSLKTLLLKKDKESQKVDFLIHVLCLPWVAEVAHELHVPSSFFFFQSATSFSLVYHLLNSDGKLINRTTDPTGMVEIPGFPLLESIDIPEYILPRHKLGPVFQEQIQTLEKNPNPAVLINTFDGLEEELIQPILNGINILSVGPLLPTKPEDSFPQTYLQWLDIKPKKSVIYVSFGSIVELGQKQKEEIFQGLIQSGHPFLWVIRNHGENDEVVNNYNMEYDGMIVKWCLQVEVLNHAAIGCSVSHCGWNWMMESVASGVAVVGFPQVVYQKINAKMAEEVWGNGVKGVADCEGVVGREEIMRCLESVMGGEEIAKNCDKLKSMGMEAMAEGGTSQTNMKKLFKSLTCSSHKHE